MTEKRRTYRPEGIIAAMVTPMHADETINEDQLRRQVDRLIDAGIHQLFCLGTNGEFYALTHKEKLCVMETVVNQCAGRVPVCAGTGAVTTDEAVSLTRAARDIGVDAVSVITPYFAALSQKEMERYYRTVAAAADMPVILYNIPARTGNRLEPETVRRLSQVGNVIAVKDSSGNYDNILRMIELTGPENPDFAVLSGNDSLILWTLEAGGRGGIAGTANLFPHLLVHLYDAWRQGDLEKARELQFALRPIRNAIALGNASSVIKRTMNAMGYPVGPARAPSGATDNPRMDEAIRSALRFYREKGLLDGESA